MERCIIEKWKWVECLAHPIPTLESVPGENTLTYIIEGVTYTFCIGDEARYYDTEKKSMYSTNYMI